MKDFDKESTSSDVKTILATIALVISILGTAMLVYLVFIFLTGGILSLNYIPMTVCVGINSVAYIIASIIDLGEDDYESTASKRAEKAKSIAGWGIGLVVALFAVLFFLSKR